MTASNHPGLKFAKRRARVLDVEVEVRAAKAHQFAVYAEVDHRDGKRCTCCGRRGDPSARTHLGKLHHDHIIPRSLRGPTDTWNIATLCWICHPFKTAHELEPTGNPDKGTLRYTVTAAAAALIFKRRTRPAHVRIVEP